MTCTHTELTLCRDMVSGLANLVSDCRAELSITPEECFALLICVKERMDAVLAAMEDESPEVVRQQQAG